MRRSVLVATAIVVCAGTAHAERYVVQPGETLEHVATAFHCSTAAILRANHRDNVLVPAHTVVEIPACARTRPAHATAADPDALARAALAAVDGAPPPPPPHQTQPAPASAIAPAVPVAIGVGSESIGEPWDGALRHGRALPASDAYVIRRPARAFGADRAIAALQQAIATVRAAHPEAPTLAIGDLSAEHGGPIGDHLSHQSGLDADVGFYFTHAPKTYPAEFVAADDGAFDLPLNHALLAALLPHAQIIFLDYAVQARLYKYAASLGAPAAELERIFQYPRGPTSATGIVRHWPHHGDHFHVRFAPR